MDISDLFKNEYELPLSLFTQTASCFTQASFTEYEQFGMELIRIWLNEHAPEERIDTLVNLCGGALDVLLFISDYDWDSFSCWAWSWILVSHPELSSRCPFDKFSDRDWDNLLSHQPQFADRYDKLEELEGLSNHTWNFILQHRPELAHKCNRWTGFDGNDWTALLVQQPQFASECKWDRLYSADWERLLCKRPQFADRCDKWSEFSGWLWEALLEEQPQFADQCMNLQAGVGVACWLLNLNLLIDAINGMSSRVLIGTSC